MARDEWSTSQADTDCGLHKAPSQGAERYLTCDDDRTFEYLFDYDQGMDARPVGTARERLQQAIAHLVDAAGPTAAADAVVDGL
ncbi:hypothetical protein, partial [Pseudonocardia terrae]|uniref:hypothetical protein n=1 Tax=Pseudonocardia terrae TaxID=2905831 RepID=UPI001E33C270